MTLLVVLSSIGGIGGLTAFTTGLMFIVKAITKLVTATKENTLALESIHDTMEEYEKTITEHTTQLAVLNDRIKRR